MHLMLKTDNEPISVDGDVAMQDMTAPVVEHAFVTVPIVVDNSTGTSEHGLSQIQNPAQVE